ncbi:ATP-binding protein [Virgisporangium aurantiacum]|uniref:ATP-binding protein n=1 Tax=Virgisporangium aurantiacum TaxID=175570 RepID=UPI00194E8409|nr:ATP-binding protein [Virgisporangium aurantiacum]
MDSEGEASVSVLGRPSRLAAVEQARLLLSASPVPLDRLARLVAVGGHAPIGAITLLDAHREYLVAGHGVHRGDQPASASLCQYVINADLPLVIEDVDRPGGPPVPDAVRAAGVASYAGYPVYLAGAAVGVVCVADQAPRRWTTVELNAVGDAASVVTAMLAEHEAAHEIAPAAWFEFDPAMRDATRGRAFLNALLGSLDTAVVACDENGRLILFNRQMRKISGELDYTTPDQWPGRHNTYHSDGRPMRTEELPLMRALNGEHLQSARMLIRSDGEPDRYYLCNGRQLRSDDGEVLGAVMAVHEVTEMVRSSRFKDCEVAVARVLEGDPPPNEAGGEVLDLVVGTLGWPWAELWLCEGKGNDLRRCATASLSPEGHATGNPPAPGHALARSAFERGRLVWARDDSATGPRPTLAVPIRSAERVLGVLTLFADRVGDPPEHLERLVTGVAAHIGMYLERRRVAELTQALAHSKDEYIGLVGHEMRTPLTSICAYTDLVLEDPELDDDLRGMLAVVQRNAGTLRGIIANLLDLAAYDSGQARVQLNPTDVADLVRTAVEAAVARTAAARAAGPIDDTWTGRGAPPAITAEIDAGIRVDADAPRLRQVVDILIGNALTYTPGTGSVVVRLGTAGRQAVLDVVDTGIGIPPNERPKLFGRFFRGRAAKGAGVPGSGLGLAISRAIVEAHEGTLELLDRPAPGSTFRVRLPLA